MKWVPICLRWLKINGRKPAAVHAVKAEFEKTPKYFKEQSYAAAIAISITLCRKVPHFATQLINENEEISKLV